MSHVEDRLDILALNAKHNWASYDCDSEAYVECYTEDGIYESVNLGSRNAGHEQLAAAVTASRDIPWSLGHISADALIDIDGDTARQRVFILLYRRESPTGENQFFGTGWYDDLLVRTPDGWRIKHRESFIDRSRLPWADHIFGADESRSAAAGDTGD